MGCSYLVWCVRRIISSVPILPKQRKGRHQTSPRTHGKEASDNRGEEGSEEKGERRVREAGADTENRGRKAKVVGLLVSEEPQVLVITQSLHLLLPWTTICTKTVIYERAHYLVSERVADILTTFSGAPYSWTPCRSINENPNSHRKTS